jgi:hypothetical protein
MDPNSGSGMPPADANGQEAPKFFVEANGDGLEPNKPLPQSYGENRLVTMVRDPLWFFAYWDATPDRFDGLRNQVGDAVWNTGQAVLRVFDVTGVDGGISQAHSSFDVPVSFDVRRWYVNVPEAGRSWITELGFRFPDGRYLAMLRSNRIVSPNGQVSSQTDSRWMVVNVSEWDKMFEVASGPSPRSSLETSKMMSQRWDFLRSVFSGSSSRLSGSPLPVKEEQQS